MFVLNPREVQVCFSICAVCPWLGGESLNSRAASEWGSSPGNHGTQKHTHFRLLPSSIPTGTPLQEVTVSGFHSSLSLSTLSSQKRSKISPFNASHTDVP